LGNKNLLKLLDRAMPSDEANLAIDRERRRQQHIHLYYAANVRNMLNRGRNAQPPQGRFHVGLQLPTFRATRA